MRDVTQRVCCVWGRATVNQLKVRKDNARREHKHDEPTTGAANGTQHNNNAIIEYTPQQSG